MYFCAAYPLFLFECRFDFEKEEPKAIFKITGRSADKERIAISAPSAREESPGIASESAMGIKAYSPPPSNPPIISEPKR